MCSKKFKLLKHFSQASIFPLSSDVISFLHSTQLTDLTYFTCIPLYKPLCLAESWVQSLRQFPVFFCQYIDFTIKTDNISNICQTDNKSISQKCSGKNGHSERELQGEVLMKCRFHLPINSQTLQEPWPSYNVLDTALRMSHTFLLLFLLLGHQSIFFLTLVS